MGNVRGFMDIPTWSFIAVLFSTMHMSNTPRPIVTSVMFYWNGDEWYSLGRQTATSDILQYKVPDNALFFLKNITKNRMYETPFIIERGAQQWFNY